MSYNFLIVIIALAGVISNKVIFISLILASLLIVLTHKIKTSDVFMIAAASLLFVGAVFEEGYNYLRFMYAIIAFPILLNRRNNNLDIRIILGVAIIFFFIIFYFQIGNAVGDEFSIALRDYINPAFNYWDYGESDEIIFAFRSFRAGGLFYNPNNMALVASINIIVFHYAAISLFKKIELNNGLFLYSYSALIIMHVFSIFLTGSRTYFFSIILFLILNYKEYMMIAGKFNSFVKYFLIALLATMLLWLIADNAEYLLTPFQDNDEGSANIKLNAIFMFLDKANFFDMLFGSNFNIHFDSEYGNWLGSGGLFALFGSTFAYSIFFFKNRKYYPVSLFLLMVAMGNSLVFSSIGFALYIYLITSIFSIKSENR